MLEPPDTPAARRAPVLLALLLLVASCSLEEYRRDADEEVYGILSAKRAETFGPAAGDQPFGIDPPPGSLRERLETALAAGERPEVSLDLPQALAAASENSRVFQSERESLYLSALALTGERDRYGFLFSGSASATVAGDGDDARSLTLGGTGGFSHILATGGQILGSLVTSFFKSLAGGGFDASSLLSISLTHSLLRGAGTLVALEPLTQAERSVVYAVRSYERFRRSFAVDLVAEYLAVLQQESNLANIEANFQSLRDNYERSVQLARAGRLAPFEVDQARQQMLSGEDGLVLARAQLKVAVDRFKLTLGLPVDVELTLDRGILDDLARIGVAALDLGAEEAIAIAFEHRLDLRNLEDQLEDSARQVRIAEQNLLFDLGLRASVSVPNESSSRPLDFAWDRFHWELGLDVDLPLERVPERNAYRASLISHASRERGLEEFLDQVKQTVRGELTDLDQAFRRYRIQELALELARKRVDSTRLLVEAGRASTRDFLESQQALLSSQNALTGALVDYVNLKLRLLRDLEILDVGPAGLSIDLAVLDRWKSGGAAAEEGR